MENGNPNELSLVQQFIRKLNEVMEANLSNEHFGVDEFAREMGLSRSALLRKLKSITHKSINQYIREARLQKAMEMLRQNVAPVSEIAYRVGFGSPAYFNTCFTGFYGYPPGEVKKREAEETEPVNSPQPFNNVMPDKNRKRFSTSTKIIVISFVVLILVSLVWLFYVKFSEKKEPVADNHTKPGVKSIAILPFINDSHDPENVYFINGVMEAILDDLSKIKDLEVRPRTSVEKYRYITSKTIPQIARELGVSYVIEGSGQKIGDQVSLLVQLIDAKSDKHIFSQRYNLKIEDIFNLQSEIALKVANEIKAIITDEEIELIQKPGTTNIAAWEMYSRGLELQNIADLEDNLDNCKQAKRYHNKAILLDSTYSDAYAELASLCFTLNKTDSALYFIDRALHFDGKNSNAHLVKGWWFFTNGQIEKAEETLKMAITYNPNNPNAFNLLADLYYYQGDSYNSIKNRLKTLKLDHKHGEKRYSLVSLWDSYNNVGLYNEALKYAERLIVLTGDSSYYYWTMLQQDYNSRNFVSVNKYARLIYNTDSLNLGKLLNFHHSYFLGNTYVNLREYKQALSVLEKYVQSMKQQGRSVDPSHYFSYIYLQNGLIEEANYHLNGSIKVRMDYIEKNKPAILSPPNLGLAFIYAGRGQKEKALQYMRIVNSCPPFLYTCAQLTGLRISPMVDCIRNEPEYIEFLKNAEERYLEEHKKVEKLLREEGIIN